MRDIMSKTLRTLNDAHSITYATNAQKAHSKNGHNLFIASRPSKKDQDAEGKMLYPLPT